MEQVSQEQELRQLLAEGAVYLAALTEAAAKLGLDMRDQTAPFLNDVAKALGTQPHGG